MVATIHVRLYAALLASFVVLGLCLAFAQPLFSAPDEPMHWISANVRVEHLLGHEGCVPTITGFACGEKDICKAIPDLTLTCANDLELYGGVLTYPGVLASKLVLPNQTESGVRQVQGIVLSRLLQGLIVLLCLVRVGFLARRTGRFGSLTLAAFALSPLFAQQAFAVSSDGAQLGFGVYLFAIVMFWEALTRTDALIFALLGYASTSKPTLLPLLLPAVCAGYCFAHAQMGERGLVASGRALLRLLKPTRKPSAQTLIVYAALVLSALTVLFSLSYDAAGQTINVHDESHGREAHLKELREHPLTVLELPSRVRFRPKQARFWTGPLGWLDSRVSPAVVNAFSRILWLSFGFELCALGWFAFRRRSSFEGAVRRLLYALPGLALGLLAVFVSVMFVTAIMYVFWTPADSKAVEGVQIRYFFPATMMVIGLVFRTVEGVALTQSERSGELRAGQRCMALAAPFLVLALSLPYVSRLYVDLALRYHNSVVQPHP